MRAAQLVGLRVAVVLQLVLLSGCANPVPATVTRVPASPLESNPVILVQATVQRERIVESLRTAGLEVTDAFADADYTLKVQVGRNRATTGCGGINNVAYVLSSEGRYLMVIKGRGSTGSCSPNIFDEMSQKLASYAGG